MAKNANRYLEVDPWQIVERGFHPEESEVSESIFSLANEYMGVRGYFEEGYSGLRVVGSYFNGVFEEQPFHYPVWWRGFATRETYMVNAVDWLHTRLWLDGEQLDLATSAITDFERRLDMRTGLLTRTFVWHTNSGKSLRVIFERFLSMTTVNLGAQRITLEPLNFTGAVEMEAGLDFSLPYREHDTDFWSCPLRGQEGDVVAILGQVVNSRQRVYSSFQLRGSQPLTSQLVTDEKLIALRFTLQVLSGERASVEKMVVNYAARDAAVPEEEVWAQGRAGAMEYGSVSFDEALAAHRTYWQQVWRDLDITIEGDPENQQGVRFCIYHLHQSYHGQDPSLNIGPKGLTGEEYAGATFWDTETYCLPFYLLNNPVAAKNLVLYRYQTLPFALERAVEMECRGACYPMVTIDGTESCGVWWYGNLEVHLGADIVYALWHYLHLCPDRELLYQAGIEVLLQISRYFASRGGWHSRTGEFGVWGVVGPDEFHIMVHNNYYTNYMVKRVFEFTLDVMEEMREADPEQLAKVTAKVELAPDEPAEWKRMAEKMRFPMDEKTGIYEQHDGFFGLPHMDLTTVNEFPIVTHWAHDRIYRYDMTKQPDVLLLMFLCSQQFSRETKRVNYEYYTPRCIQDSSLSPAIHGILAAELGKHEEANEFCRFATRLDLDNYNRNTNRGLHVSSMGAAWMSLVYGFGGLRSDGEILVFEPALPGHWQSFSFRLQYQGSLLQVRVDPEWVTLNAVSGPPVPVKVFGENYEIGARDERVPLPADRRGPAPA